MNTTIDDLVTKLRCVRVSNILKRREKWRRFSLELDKNVREYSTSPARAVYYFNEAFCLDLDCPSLDDEKASCILHDMATLPVEMVHERLYKEISSK
jgi:hypothetical protein